MIISHHLHVIQVSNIITPLLKSENNERCFSQLILRKFYQTLETKDFEKVYSMYDPNDCFKAFR